MAGSAIDIKADVSGAQAALEGTKKSLKSIQRMVLRVVARGTSRQVKAAIRTTARRTGALMKSYGYKVRKDASSVTVYPKSGTDAGRTNYIKAAVLSWGRPERHIEPRGFVQAGVAYAEGGSYGREVDEAVEKELRKLWG